MSDTWVLRYSCLFQIASMGILFSFDAVRMKDMGVSESAIGLILGASSGVFIFSTLFWGRLADRKRWHKPIVTFGTLGLIGLLFFFAACRNVAPFFVYAILKAVIMPMIAGIMPAIAVKCHGQGNQGSKFGVYRAFGSIGFIMGTMLLPLAFNDIGIVAQVASVFMISSLFLIHKLPAPDKVATLGVHLRIRDLDPSVKLFLFSFFFISLADPAVHVFFNAYARDLGGSTRLLGLLSGLMGLVAFVCLPLMGMAVDRSRPRLILAVALFAQPLRVYLISLIGNENYLWIPVLLHGVCWGGIEVSAVVYLSRRVEEDQRATVLSYYMAVRMLGNLAGASLCGYLADSIGYVFMFRAISAAALVGALVYSVGIQLMRDQRTT